ncbi:MAG: D-alanyl-D-alanine dipeptidase [Bacteroidales bacterium]|nr:D-alanyl-D-alanine dipeptidase [Bacteroidales bacterium]
MLHLILYIVTMKIKAILLLLFTTAAPVAAQNFKGLVNIQKLDSAISVELMYAKADNFVGEKMYNFSEAYLHPKAAVALKKANKLLKEINPNLHLRVYDAARPMRVQQKMWNKVKGTAQQNYVSNPANGGGLHNYGLAVDVTIADSKGDTLPMGTTIDALTSASHIDREEELVLRGKITAEAAKNRLLLRTVMKKAGFRPLRSEWWHFNWLTGKVWGGLCKKFS